MSDAVADGAAEPQSGALRGRLERIDRRRKGGVMLGTAVLAALCMAGAAAAWPEDQPPIELRVGSEENSGEDAAPPDVVFDAFASGSHAALQDEAYAELFSDSLDARLPTAKRKR